MINFGRVVLELGTMGTMAAAGALNLVFAYWKRSTITPRKDGLAISLAPNLRRDRVSYVGHLGQPIRFREAISALHDVVISDLRFKPRDKTAYRVFLAERAERENRLRLAAAGHMRAEMKKHRAQPVPPDLEPRFRRMRKQYWDARQEYSNHLAQHDPELWRLLMPCDPVITVAQDILFFECFSFDESSYGCLSVDRGAFTREQDVAVGTTNVDYSWDLYEHFQTMRSYRETQFQIDPAGFSVATEGAEDYREEKIALPASWLRGFMQMQAAQSFPLRRLIVPREAVYSLLAFLKRNKARRSPRALRFEMEPGQPIHIVLEPWDQRIVLHDTIYEGTRPEAIRTWGRDRLRVLGRLLPLLDRAEVYLLGTGLPSFWVAHMGEMRLTLGLSGWTANDWTAANALDQILPPAEPGPDVLAHIASSFHDQPAQSFAQIQQKTGATAPFVAVGLNRLALLGQVIHDLPAGLYRWRQVMPVPLAKEQIGADNPETVAARGITAKKRVTVTKDDRQPKGLRVLEGQVEGKPISLMIDADGRILRGKCNCSYHFKSGIRRGPCRHLQALRNTALGGVAPASLEKWFEHLWKE